MAAWCGPLIADEPPLQFIEPRDGQVFTAPASVPVVVRGESPSTVFPTADLFANGKQIAWLTFCCHLCPCFHPSAGITTTLQIPVIWDQIPPGRMWQDWTNVPAGTYRLVAKSSGDSGTLVETAPVTIHVLPGGLDLSLRVSRTDDGVLHFTIPDGALVAGSIVLETSDDLLVWRAVMDFRVGDVGAFAEDRPGATVQGAGFYRAKRKQ